MTVVIDTIGGVIETIGGMRRAVRTAREESGAAACVVLVPTMGALHAGHLSMIRRAREIGDVVVASVFVNPLQFGPQEDLDRYPRRLEADVAALQEAGTDLVFAPTAGEMYPHGGLHTRVSAGELGSRYEGAARPGHFDGVLTVVAKLFHIVQPDAAVFGQKDAQQAFLVRRMVAELDMPVAIDVVPTVREADGLALSSRNQYLDAGQRTAATRLSAGLRAGVRAADGGRDAALAAVADVIGAERTVKLDYLVIVDPLTFDPVDAGFRGEAIMLVAAMVGTTRLIDNESLTLR